MLNSIKFKKSKVFNLKFKNSKLKICSLFLAVIFLVTVTPVLAAPTIRQIEKSGTPDNKSGTYVVSESGKTIRYSVRQSQIRGNGQRFYEVSVTCGERVAKDVSGSQLEGIMIGHFCSQQTQSTGRSRSTFSTYSPDSDDDSEDEHLSHRKKEAALRKCKLLTDAVEAGDLDRIRSLLESGVNPNSCISRLPLYIAVEKGQEACVKLLLEKGADPNLSSGSAMPLGAAAEKGYEACVRLLLEKGADPNVVCGYVRTSNATPLYIAADNGHEACVKLLLEKGADPNVVAEVCVSCGVFNCFTPLLKAASKNHYDIVKLLLENGANPSCATNTNETARNLCTDDRVDALLKSYGVRKPGFFKQLAGVMVGRKIGTTAKAATARTTSNPVPLPSEDEPVPPAPPTK